MVGLSLAPLKVLRRAVRILVLTVRSATARWRATPLVGHGPDRSPRTTGAGRSPYLIGVESGSRSVTQLTRNRSGSLD
jgi:hypothetical protein